ncbi:uncharacterized protein LOC110453566 isoform X2 [Mizuhopecten yessoensis]|uniref:Uncharacterized protein n=2 Tax=Mizuhopecten yessoensis TaxID=6573 RepID=A0A210R4I5_MIZYE|nr:uncharacterized protein LOC110453566 isoform X2 [Mizuhopecten yessoensis]XP_021358251.1 uncharacterized protein LOC110453566 isoform X2 [Mizuhopecten yessoensis]OWF55960.1 hypothetical protein KP79_PYT22118 [Mizuhopecten yessoensis]
MATNKKLALTNNTKHNEVILKQRVKELEDEVASLRKRLDDLRKAKNTTVLKREREILEVGTPFSKRESAVKAAPVPAPQKLTDNHDGEIEELRKKFASEIEILKEQEKSCDHESEIEALQRYIYSLEADNAALLIENTDLKDRVTSLVTDLSIKEAKWCEMEEKLKIDINRSWGEKYKDWMEKTEAKITELQQTNTLLRGYLKGHKPGGAGPTEKDPGV